MQINKITPNFKGLIVLQKGKQAQQAIDTKDISYFTAQQPCNVWSDEELTFIKTYSNPKGEFIEFKAPFTSVVDAYKEAVKSDTAVVSVKL